MAWKVREFIFCMLYMDDGGGGGGVMTHCLKLYDVVYNVGLN